MSYIQGENRFQKTFMPDSIDEYIDEENPTRVIDAFVESLNMEELEFKMYDNECGRPAYNPKDMLKLYIYGYFNKVRSSRKLERETKINIEVIWLMNKLSPDHKTISRFRKDNVKALKSTFRSFVKVCLKLNLYKKELIAIDGSKFKAVNSLEKNFSKGKLEDRIKRIDKKLNEYISNLDDNDEKEVTDNKYTKEEIENAINELNSKKENYNEMESKLENSGETQISITDKDCKRMKHRNGLSEMCYNVQTAVDSENKLIAEFEVTSRCNDKNLLTPMAEKAKEILEVEEIVAVADNGYFVATDIANSIKNNITPHVAKGNESITFSIETTKENATTPQEWENQGKNIFIAERNIGLCPMGTILYPRGYSKSRKAGVFANSTACRECVRKDKCKKYYKEIEIKMTENEFSKEYNDKDLYVKQITYLGDEKIIKERKGIVEHPFGTIKRHMNAGYCLLKGRENVQGEFSLSFLAYNLKRVINIIGVKELIAEFGY